MWGDIWINCLSDLIFSLLVFIFWFAVFHFNKRKKLLKFFGIEKSKKLTIFTSNLIVEKYGSLGANGVRYSFQGTAIPNEESKAATSLQSLFNYFLPSQVEKPSFLSKLLISDIDVMIFPSPVEGNLIEQNASIISLGFPPYNLISRFIENSFHPLARLTYIPPIDNFNSNTTGSNSHETSRMIPSDNAPGTAVSAGFASTSRPYYIPSGIARVISTSPNTGTTSASSVSHSEGDNEQPQQPAIEVQDVPPFTETCVGFVQKIFDSQNQRYLFYVAGLSENSTAGSAYYLVNNWEYLNKTYGSDASFCILLKVSNTNNRISQIIHKS
jgi:hypothetical protein